MKKLVISTLYALLNIHFLMSYIMNNNSWMNAGLTPLPSLSLCVFFGGASGSWCGRMAY